MYIARSSTITQLSENEMKELEVFYELFKTNDLVLQRR